MPNNMYIFHFTIYRNFLPSFSHLKMRLIKDGKFLVMVRIKIEFPSLRCFLKFRSRNDEY